jgi:hypothetical protein
MIIESKGKTHELPDSFEPELMKAVYGSKMLALTILGFWETLQGSVPEDLGKDLTLMFFQFAQSGSADVATEL